jgi:hypothetical protein
MDSKEHQNIRGYVAPKPEKAPTNLQEVLFQAELEHRKFHTNDGMSLFVWATASTIKTKLYIYPISALDLDTSLQIAQNLHEQRGLPPSDDWRLLFPDENDEQRIALIQ